MVGILQAQNAIVRGGTYDSPKERIRIDVSGRYSTLEDLRELRLREADGLVEIYRAYLTTEDENHCEVNLLLEGITCAACVWLNEAQLRKQSGVTAVSVNYSTRRARVQWDARATKLSNILAAVAAIGYRAHPYDIARAEALAQAEGKSALWRLFVAGFGMMQVMMYAVPVYMADVGAAGDMTVGIEQLMRWASLLLTLPVMLYSAGPFFVSARRDLRRLSGRLGLRLTAALVLLLRGERCCWTSRRRPAPGGWACCTCRGCDRCGR